MLGISPDSKIIDIMSDAQIIINGDNNMSVIKNFDQKSIPNTSVSFTDFRDEAYR